MPDSRPWDLITQEWANASTVEARMDICRACDKFTELTKQCSECWCIMPLKTKLALASCPLDKWGPEQEEV